MLCTECGYDALRCAMCGSDVEYPNVTELQEAIRTLDSLVKPMIRVEHPEDHGLPEALVQLVVALRDVDEFCPCPSCEDRRSHVSRE